MTDGREFGVGEPSVLPGIAKDLGWRKAGQHHWSYELLCKLAEEAYWRNRPRRPLLDPTLRPRCASRFGALDHYAAQEKPCLPCSRAHALWNKVQYRATHPRPLLQPCGTRAAYIRHRRRGEAPCAPCREAEDAYIATRFPRGAAA